MLRNFLLVGGASAYAPGLVNALIHSADRHQIELVRLYDIDERRLEVVYRLLQRLTDAAGSPFRIEATTDQTEAVQDIDVLLNSSRPGGFEARRIDETLPLQFEIPGQETVGPGGFFFALRSIPAAMDLAEDVAAHAPDAIWLNYTNPTNIVAQALVEHTDLNVVALCDQSDEDLEAVADALGYPDGVDYHFECNGLNHATWYRQIRIDDHPLPDAVFQADPPDYYDREHKLRFELSAKMARRQSEPIWPNSYLPYYEAPGQFVELSRRVGPRTDAILEKIDDYYEHFEQVAADDNPQLRHYRGSSGFGDMAADVLVALSSDTPTDLVLNVSNRGITDEFADDTVVEARAGLSGDGIHRRPAPPMPDDHRSLLQQLEVYQRRTAEAAVGGDTDQLVRALAANPLVEDRELARSMLKQARRAYEHAVPLLSQ